MDVYMANGDGHSACSVCSAPTGLTEVGRGNAESGLNIQFVPSCTEESWICS